MIKDCVGLAYNFYASAGIHTRTRWNGGSACTSTRSGLFLNLRFSSLRKTARVVLDGCLSKRLSTLYIEKSENPNATNPNGLSTGKAQIETHP